MKYLDPKSDLAFKRLLGKHPHLRISCLNVLLPLAEGRIVQSIESNSNEYAGKGHHLIDKPF